MHLAFFKDRSLEVFASMFVHSRHLYDDVSQHQRYMAVHKASVEIALHQIPRANCRAQFYHSAFITIASLDAMFFKCNTQSQYFASTCVRRTFCFVCSARIFFVCSVRTYFVCSVRIFLFVVCGFILFAARGFFCSQCADLFCLQRADFFVCSVRTFLFAACVFILFAACEFFLFAACVFILFAACEFFLFAACGFILFAVCVFIYLFICSVRIYFVRSVRIYLVCSALYFVRCVTSCYIEEYYQERCVPYGLPYLKHSLVPFSADLLTSPSFNLFLLQ